MSIETGEGKLARATITVGPICQSMPEARQRERPAEMNRPGLNASFSGPHSCSERQRDEWP